MVVYHHLASQSMSRKWSPLTSANESPPGGLFGPQQRWDNVSESSDNSLRTATGKHSQLGQHTNQYHPPQGYGYPPAHQPFPGAPPIYQHHPFNMTPSSQPTTSASQRYPSYRTTWAMIWPPPRWIWWVSNVRLYAVYRTRAIISSCTEIASRITGKQCSHLANMIQLYYSTRTAFRWTWETPHYHPNEMIPAPSGTAEDWWHEDRGLPHVASDVVHWLWYWWCERRFVGHGQCREQTPNQPEANWILLGEICPQDGASQPQCIQWVEEGRGSWVSRAKASVHFLGADSFEIASQWTPDQPNVNWSGSNTQSSQTLRATSPVLLGTSRCSQTPLELSKVLSDFARAFSGAHESTCSYGGAFRMLRDLTYRIVKFWSFWDLCADLWETSRAAETAAQLCGRLQERPRPLLSTAGDLVPFPHSSGSYITPRHFVFVTVTRFATS